MYGYIFLAECKSNGKKFIGKFASVKFNKLYFGDNPGLISDVEKYGKENFSSLEYELVDIFKVGLPIGMIAEYTVDILKDLANKDSFLLLGSLNHLNLLNNQLDLVFKLIKYNKTVFNTPQKTTVVDNKPAKNPIESYNKSVLERLFPAEGFVAKSADNQPKKYSKPASAENTPESPKALAKSFVYDDEAQAANNVAVPNAGVPKKTENSAIYSNPNVIGVADDIIAEFENNHGYSFDYTYRKNGNTINVCNVNDVYHVQVKNDNMKYSQTIGNIKKW